MIMYKYMYKFSFQNYVWIYHTWLDTVIYHYVIIYITLWYRERGKKEIIEICTYFTCLFKSLVWKWYIHPVESILQYVYCTVMGIQSSLMEYRHYTVRVQYTHTYAQVHMNKYMYSFLFKIVRHFTIQLITAKPVHGKVNTSGVFGKMKQNDLIQRFRHSWQFSKNVLCGQVVT